jgi:hypothetical protein
MLFLQYNTGNDPGKEKRLGAAAYPYPLLRIAKKKRATQIQMRCSSNFVYTAFHNNVPNDGIAA